jgi:hypothetical protein
VSSLYLQESRQVPTELGFGLVYDFARVNRQAVRDLVADGDLLLTDDTQPLTGGTAPQPTCEYDEVAGHFMGRIDRDLADTPVGANELTGTWTSGVRTKLTQAGTYASGYEQADDGAWELEFPGQAWGACKHFWFVTYDKAQSPIILSFGGVWKLNLYDTGEAWLSKLRTYTVDEGLPTEHTDSVYEPVDGGVFDWMSQEEFAPAVHWLAIYQNQSKLIIRNMAQNRAGKTLGVAYTDTGDELPEDEWVPEDGDYPVDADGNALKFAIRGGSWFLSGTGKITIGLPPLTWIAETAILQSQTIATSAGGSTQPCEVTLKGQGGDGTIAATVETFDQDDAEWPQSGAAFDPAKTAIRWLASWTSTTALTYFLSYLGITIPRVMIADGNTGTDVIALTNVGDKQVTLSREGNLTNERLSATFFANRTNLASYVQPNMAVRYVVNGGTVFRGVTRGATWNVLADTTTPTGLLTIDATGLWGRFEKALWPGGQAFDGRKLTDCLAEVVGAAGLAPAEYSIDDWDFEFPIEPDGEAPTLVYQPGTPIARILEDFRESWYGQYHLQYFRLSDGVLSSPRPCRR